MRADRLLGAAALAVVTLLGDRASAFCRTTTVNVPADYDPHISGCWPSGYPLWWSNACVGYDIQQDASMQISYDDAANGLALAFTRWTSTNCQTPYHGTGLVSIDVRDLGPVACDVVEYNNNGGPNQNAIIFRDHDWPYDDTSNTLALTTVTYDPDTGQMYDADMEINTYQYTLTPPSMPLPANGYDFLAIVTHETGHFLGMAHATDINATMYAHYTQGSEAMRFLTEDDVNGICTIYPPDGTRAVSPAVATPGTIHEGACDPTPMGGFTSQCVTGGGCAVAPRAPLAPGRGSSSWPIALGLLALGARRRRGR